MLIHVDIWGGVTLREIRWAIEFMSENEVNRYGTFFGGKKLGQKTFTSNLYSDNTCQ